MKLRRAVPSVFLTVGALYALALPAPTSTSEPAQHDARGRRAEPYTPPALHEIPAETDDRRTPAVSPFIDVEPPTESEIAKVQRHNRESRQPVVGIPRQLRIPHRLEIPTNLKVSGERTWKGGLLASPGEATVRWTGAVHSAGASGLSLTLSGLRPAAGLSWRVYGATGIVYEFSPSSSSADSPVVPGDTIWLEVDARVDSSEVVAFEIVGVSYVRDELLDGPRATVDLDLPYINAVCASDGDTPAHRALKDLQKAVGYMRITHAGKTSTCTGTLINNTRDPGVPYFITAEHCANGLQPGSASLSVYWDYLNASCPDPTTKWTEARLDALPKSIGAVLLVSGSADVSSDFALFRLNSLPFGGAGRHFVGWSTFPFASDFFRLSHPESRPLVFSRHEWRRQDWREDCQWWEVALGSCRNACEGRGYDRYYYSTVKQGAVFQGSSGSGAINISVEGGNYFVGQLFGFCTDWVLLGGADPRGMDGALNYYFDRVAAWLDPPAECQDIILQVFPSGSTGTVQKITAPNCGTLYRAGTRVWIRAIPDPGFEFDHWDAGVIEDPTAAATYATIRADITPVYRAYFRPATPPANDRCGFATLVTASPFTDVVATTGATTDDAHDPVPSCNPSRRKNVWYRFTAATTDPIIIDTSGSNYQTIIALYRGTDCFALSPVACSAVPLATTTNSALQFTPEPGASYKLQIAGVNPPTISTLAVRIEGSIADDPPIASDGIADGQFGPVTQPFPAVDPEGGRLRFRIVSGPSQGTVTIDQEFGEFTYTPNTGAATEDSFQYMPNDGTHDAAAPATIRIILRPPLTLTVTTTADAPDDVPGNGVCLATGFGCTLRAAVMELNANGGRPGVIRVPPGVFALTGAPGEDMAITGDLDIRVPTVFEGAGAQETFIQSATDDRVLDVPVNVQVTLKAVSVQNGRVTGRGGGIRSAGVLSIEDVVVKNNVATAEGGGISSTNALRVMRSSLIGNASDAGEHSGVGAGALRVVGTAVVMNSTVAQNFSDGPGGAIRNYGRLFIGYSTIIDNTTRAGATAIDTWSEDDPALLLKSNIIGGSCLVTDGVVQSVGYNVVLMPGCANTPLDRTVMNFHLAPLATQPGGTVGAMPLTTSPAVDSIPASACLDWVEQALIFDQRNGVRPRDGDGDDLAACDAGALERDTPAPRADMGITKTDSVDPVLVGSTLTYTIAVTNQGPNAATNVTVSDPLPAGVTLVSVTPSQGSCSGTSTVTCGLGGLASSASATVILVVEPTSPGNISNTASVTALEVDPDSTNNSATESTTVNAPAGVRVVAPNGGEKLFLGVPFSIGWALDAGAPASFDVAVSMNGGSTFSNIPGCTGLDGALRTCGWIPGVATKTGRLRVTAHDSGGRTTSDLSDGAFTVVSGSPGITVTAPNTGGAWAIGSTQAVTWKHNLGPTATFTVALSRDGGASWTPIGAGVPAATATTGAFNWAVVGPTTSAAWVRVGWDRGPTVDVSNAPFSIVAPQVTVTAPDSAVNWGLGSRQAIKWKHNIGTAALFTIALSHDGGVTYPELVAQHVPAATATTGSYTWQVAGPAGTQKRIRVTSESTAASDAGNANLTIAPVFIKVTAPKGTAIWGYDTSQLVAWSTNLGPTDVVDVQLSVDGGSSFPITLVSGVPALPKKAMVVTPTLSSPTGASRARVVWTNAPAPFAASGINPADFTIAPPFIAVTSPIDSSVWTRGSGQEVTYASNLGTADRVTIESDSARIRVMWLTPGNRGVEPRFHHPLTERSSTPIPTERSVLPIVDLYRSVYFFFISSRTAASIC